MRLGIPHLCVGYVRPAKGTPVKKPPTTLSLAMVTRKSRDQTTDDTSTINANTLSKNAVEAFTHGRLSPTITKPTVIVILDIQLLWFIKKGMKFPRGRLGQFLTLLLDQSLLLLSNTERKVKHFQRPRRQ